MSLRDELQLALRTAMRERDRQAVSLYRSTLAAIANAEAVPLDDIHASAVDRAPLGVGAADVERRELSDDELEAVVRREAEERRTASHVTGIPESTRVQLAREADYLETLSAR